MRIDKYIWAIRVVKTRSQASKVCKEGKVEVDGKKAKASKVLKVGETIVVRKGAVYFSYKVLHFPKSRVGASLVTDYTVDVTEPEQLEKLEMIKLAHADRPRGVGRPTKRDRRDWVKAFED
jgi:ribosome-associated heat shock protein Hsp15